jgi:hypothetical protein
MMESLFGKKKNNSKLRFGNKIIFIRYPIKVEESKLREIIMKIFLKAIKEIVISPTNIIAEESEALIEFYEQYESKSAKIDPFIYNDLEPEIWGITAKNALKIREILLPDTPASGKRAKVIIKKKEKSLVAPTPLAYSDYTENFPNIEERPEAPTGFTNKPLKQFLDNTIPGVNAKSNISYTMLTVDFLPNTLTLASAWELMPHFEKQIITLLEPFDDIQYIVSGIETHTKKPKKKAAKKKEDKDNKKKDEKDKPGEKDKSEENNKTSTKKATSKKNKKKEDEDEDQDEDEDKEEELPVISASNNFVHSLTNDNKPDTIITKEDYVEEILRVFRVYNKELKPDISAITPIPTVAQGYTEAIEFGKSMNVSLSEALDDNKDKEILFESAPEIYEALRKRGGPGFQPRPNNLKGFPHVHMIIARTKDSNTGEFRNLSEYFNALVLPKTIFTDIFIEDLHGSAGKRHRGGQLDLNDSNLLAYCLKNTNHGITIQRLGRPPCTLYNFKKIPEVNILFSSILRHSKITIRNVTLVQELPATTQVRPKNKKTTSIEDAVSRIAAFMNKNKYRFYYPNTEAKDEIMPEVWTKIPDSINTWRYCYTPLQLWGIILSENMDLNTYKTFFLDSCKTGTFKPFPILQLDYQMVEFKDFFFHIDTGTTTKISKYPSFYYNRKIKLEDLANFGEHNPVAWLNVFKNSGYVDLNSKPTKRGKQLMIDLYRVYKHKCHKNKMPLLYGSSDSCKSSIISPMTSLYPSSVIANIRKGGNFTTETALGKQILNLDEYGRNSGLTANNFKTLVGGDQDCAPRKNQKATNTVFYARVAGTANDIDFFLDSYKATPSSSEIVDVKTIKEAITLHDKYEGAIRSDFQARVNFYIFCPMPQIAIKQGLQTDVNRKFCGNILLYLALNYFDGRLINEDNEIELDKIIKKSFNKSLEGSIRAIQLNLDDPDDVDNPDLYEELVELE